MSSDSAAERKYGQRQLICTKRRRRRKCKHTQSVPENQDGYVRKVDTVRKLNEGIGGNMTTVGYIMKDYEKNCVMFRGIRSEFTVPSGVICATEKYWKETIGLIVTYWILEAMLRSKPKIIMHWGLQMTPVDCEMTVPVPKAHELSRKPFKLSMELI